MWRRGGGAAGAHRGAARCPRAPGAAGAAGADQSAGAAD